MPRSVPCLLLGLIFGLAAAGAPPAAQAAKPPAKAPKPPKLTVEVHSAQEVTFVGAFNRWDEDGGYRKKVNKDAKIDDPEVDAEAVAAPGNKWVFKKLEPGNYDLVIMTEHRVRIEGFRYPPVLDFDPFFPGDATAEDEPREYILNDIEKSPHFEDKVEALYMGGDKKAVRVLVQLRRSGGMQLTAGGTIRHEIWQYDFNYGGWQKNRRTRVLDRQRLELDEVRQWTWVWDPKLGGIEIGKAPRTIKYEIPAKLAPEKLKGLYPF